MNDGETTPAPSGRALRTRDALVAAGRKLLADKPVDAVAIDDIVLAAGVSKGSFYNHFLNKDALVRLIAGDIRSGIEQAVAMANEGVEDPARRTARAVCVYLRYAIDEPERANVLLRIHGGHTSITAPLNRGLVDDISSGLASGRFAIATLESGMLYVLGVAHVALARLAQDRSLPLAVALAQQMCALLLRGLGIARPEAETIAAQAADEVVRREAGSNRTGR